jgi:hypothetical protein
MTIALAILWVAAGYVALGAAFSVAFLWKGVGRVDPAARGAHPLFRVFILPGVVALWPILLRAWLSAPADREHHP